MSLNANAPTDTTAAVPEMYKCSHGKMEMLTHSNYQQWYRRMESFLRAENALGIAHGTEAAPAANASRALMEYNQRAGKAHAMILFSCTFPIQAYIDDMQDPAEMWRTLKEKLDTANTHAGQITTMHRFNNMRPLATDTSLNDYIMRLTNCRKELANTPYAIDDHKFITHLQTTLPPTYRTIIKIIAHQPAAMKTYNYVVETLLEEERSMKNEQLEDATTSSSNTSLTSGNALAVILPPRHARFNSHSRGSRGFSRNSRIQKRQLPLRCFYCARIGHIALDCRIKKDAEAYQAEREAEEREANATAGAAYVTVQPL